MKEQSAEVHEHVIDVSESAMSRSGQVAGQSWAEDSRRGIEQVKVQGKTGEGHRNIGGGSKAMLDHVTAMAWGGSL